MRQEGGPKKLKPGDTLHGIVVKSLGGRRFLVRSKMAPRDWKVELHTQRPELVDEGASGSFWIVRVSPIKKEILVSDGDFGRLPISEAMATRYLAGLRAVLGEEELTSDSLADLRSMVERTESRKAADWLTVWQALGEPEPGWAKELLIEIDKVKVARKEKPEELGTALEELQAKYGDQLRAALRRL